MRDFTGQFPSDGFYVVTSLFHTENMEFIPGEPVGIMRWGESCNVRITKTGSRFGGWTNYLEVEHMPKLRPLSFDEVSELAGGVTITAEAVQSIDSLARACQLITGSIDPRAPITYTAKADRWGMGQQTTITVTKIPDGQIKIIDHEYNLEISQGATVKVSYNGLQLRFEGMPKIRSYIVIDEQHNPPVPIKQMYAALK